MLLKGRYGYFTPKNPIDRAKARKQTQQRRAQAAIAASWLERHRWCFNGCGKAAAMGEAPYFVLQHNGCCSQACADQLTDKEICQRP